MVGAWCFVRGCWTARRCTAARGAPTRSSVPGQLNLMTAGNGVAHAELAARPPLRGAQMWIAQPNETRHAMPAFEHGPEVDNVLRPGRARFDPTPTDSSRSFTFVSGGASTARCHLVFVEWRSPTGEQVTFRRGDVLVTYNKPNSADATCPNA